MQNMFCDTVARGVRYLNYPCSSPTARPSSGVDMVGSFKCTQIASFSEFLWRVARQLTWRLHIEQNLESLRRVVIIPLRWLTGGLVERLIVCNCRRLVLLTMETLDFFSWKNLSLLLELHSGLLFLHEKAFVVPSLVRKGEGCRFPLFTRPACVACSFRKKMQRVQF